jgi:hypothetical protein
VLYWQKAIIAHRHSIQRWKMAESKHEVVFAAVALIIWRRRLAVDLVRSGAFAWLLAQWLKTVIERERQKEPKSDALLFAANVSSTRRYHPQ